MAVLPCIILYLIIALKEKNISINNEKNNMHEKGYILLIGLLPILILGATGAISNSRVIGAWGSAMLSYIGVILFYFFPIKFEKNTFKIFVKLLYTVVIAWIIGIGIFSLIQIQPEIRYPNKLIMSDFDNLWAAQTNNSELKYVGGYIDYVFQFRLHNKKHPTVILDTFGYKNPWIDHNDVMHSGAIFILSRNTVEKWNNIIRNSIILLPSDYKIKYNEYKYEICNVAGKCSTKNFYYSINPPQK
jgi:hypothetical protein